MELIHKKYIKARSFKSRAQTQISKISKQGLVIFSLFLLVLNQTNKLKARYFELKKDKVKITVCLHAWIKRIIF